MDFALREPGCSPFYPKVVLGAVCVKIYTYYIHISFRYIIYDISYHSHMSIHINKKITPLRD